VNGLRWTGRPPGDLIQILHTQYGVPVVHQVKEKQSSIPRSNSLLGEKDTDP
jgi:hypothetical protein